MDEQEVFDALKYRIEVDEYGSRRYYTTNGILHRTDGPAMELCDDTKLWMRNGLKHRTDGPAVTRASGSKEWWQNGRLHRTDGPAIIYSNGRKEWYINGKALTETEFNQRVQSL